MNQNQFLAELAKKLKNLPQAERDSALLYYEEYFRDADTAQDTDVTQIFGEPSAVAAKIIGEYVLSDGEIVGGDETKAKMSIGKKVWFTILAIFAAPIAMPIAIAIVSVLFALTVAMFSVFIALGCAGIGVVITGIAAFAGVLFARPIDFGTVVFFLGYSMFCVALGSAMCLGIVKLARKAFSAVQKGISKFVGKFLVRRASV